MPFVRSLQSLLGAGDGPSDTDLLGRFVRDRDQSAFELLVWRHGGLVFRACRAVLGDRHAAEDAFQATFLALARNAAVVGRRGTVAGWLYRVARRVATRARQRAVRQGIAVPVQPGDLSRVPAPVSSPHSDSETVQLLHEELGRLPPRYREPLLLCYLEGLTHAETAHRLGWPIGTVATRVARAKESLGHRLARRGIAVPAVGAGILFTNGAEAVGALAPSFVRDTTAAAVRYAEGRSASGVSVTVLNMAREASRMDPIKIAWAVGVAAAGVVIAAVCAIAADSGSYEPQAEPPYVRSALRRAPVPKAPAKIGLLTFVREGRIASIRPDGSDLTLHTPEWALGRKDIDLMGPRFDPTGKRVAYGVIVYDLKDKSSAFRSSIRVRTLDQDSSEVDMGVEGKTWCWSPDGTRIVVSNVEQTADGKPTTRTRIVDVRTKTATVVKLPPGHLVTDWSPDGAWFLTEAPSYVNGVSTRRVTVMKTDGTAAERLNDRKHASGGRFSPDGKMVAFETFDYVTREGQLHIAPIAGGNARSSGQPLRGEVMGMCWSPDGKRIASVWKRSYVKPEPNQKAEFFIRVTDLDGGNEMIIRKETGIWLASERGPFHLSQFTMSGLDWR